MSYLRPVLLGIGIAVALVLGVLALEWFSRMYLLWPFLVRLVTRFAGAV